MWKAKKIELIKNSKIYNRVNEFYYCYSLKIDGVLISNHIDSDFKIGSPTCFQTWICTECGHTGCQAGGILGIRRHEKSLWFIPCFDDMVSNLEHDCNDDIDGDYGDPECPPHKWYENGILEVDEIVLPEFLKL